MAARRLACRRLRRSGEGDAVALRTGSSSAVPVHAGPDPPLVDRCLSRLRVTTLDAVVLTHFHADHVDGLVGALDGRPASPSCSSPPCASQPRRGRCGGGARGGARHPDARVLRAGDRLTVGTPTPVRCGVPGDASPTGRCRTTRVSCLPPAVVPVDALLLGDVEREAGARPAAAACAESRRWRSRCRRCSEVVKTPHHGSANFDDDLMAAVAGTCWRHQRRGRQRYGHPAAAAPGPCCGATGTRSTAPTSTATSRSPNAEEALVVVTAR